MLSRRPRWPAEGERVLLDERAHGRLLLLPAVLVPVTVGLSTYGWLAAPAGHWQRPLRAAVLLAAVLLAGRGSLLPWLRWRGTRLRLSDRRLLVHRGVLGRPAADWDLARILAADADDDWWTRVLGGRVRVVVHGLPHRVTLPPVADPGSLAGTLLAAAERRRSTLGPQLPSVP